ncbi:hypothetical protein FUA19_15130 [Bacillus subtilis]|nr:hypothetical protein MY9_3843 [Bacillus sp. JS]NLS89489.1 hypothetical protein [Bacillus subtilis]TXF69389.1 hypothetical protein FUA19_15130 [Bacillus subtilis]
MPSMLRYSTEPTTSRLSGTWVEPRVNHTLVPICGTGVFFYELNICDEKDMNDFYGFQRGKKR